jgi:hypothetical protein
MPVLRATALTVRWGNVDTGRHLGCHRIRVLSLLGRAPHSAETPNPSDPAPSPDREWPGGTFGFVEVQPAIPSCPASVFTENGEMK